MEHFVKVDPSSAIPIWKQIEEGVRRAIAKGDLAPGDAVPSVREAALKGRINPATVSKAYRGLVDGGLLVVRRGEGTFVSDSVGTTVDDLRKQELRKAAEIFVSNAKDLGVGEEDSYTMIHRIWGEWGEKS